MQRTVTIPLMEYEAMKENLKVLETALKDNRTLVEFYMHTTYSFRNYKVFTMSKDELISGLTEELKLVREENLSLRTKLIPPIKKKRFFDFLTNKPK